MSESQLATELSVARAESDLSDLPPPRSSTLRRMTDAERAGLREEWRPPRGAVWSDEALHPVRDPHEVIFTGTELLPGKRRAKQLELNWYLAQGYSIRAAARAAGVAHNTARLAYRRIRAAGFEPLCACGRPSTHQGWCRARYAASPARRAVMARMHAEK